MISYLISLLLLSLGFMTFFTPQLRFINVSLITLAAVSILKPKFSRFIIPVFFFLMISGVIVTGILEGGKVMQELATPLGNHFTTDMRAFIKTYRYMKEDWNYYPAFQKSMSLIMRDYFAPDIGGWREPLVFYLWKILPGTESSIYYLWQVFIILNLTCGYLISRKFLKSSVALLSPLILFPYFHFSLIDLTFLQIEWWAVSFFIFGITALLYKKLLIAGILFALSLASRELFILPISILVLISLFVYKKESLKIIFPLLIFLVYYFCYHLPNIFVYKGSLIRSYRNGSTLPLQATLAFSSWSYLFGTLKPFLILITLSIAGLMLKIPTHKLSVKYLYLPTSFLPFFTITLVLSFIGGLDTWHDYWGIYYIPLVLISAPALILPPGK